MSENRKVGFVVAAENETKQTFDEIKRDAGSMAQSVEQSGKRAAKGMQDVGDSFKKTGDGADDASKKVDASTRSLINSIQRATAAAEAGEKGSSKYFETLAKQRGIGGDVLEPYLAQMRKAEAAQAASVKTLGSMEMSAKQTTAALRGVPAQFTDIFVSLQGGQAPLTVLLQQGGQLKDMFGGTGAAAKALGGYVLSLISPTTLLAAGVAAVGVAYYQGSKEQDAWVKGIVTTGNASGVTVSQLRDYARQIDAVVGTQAKAAEGLAAFAAAGIQGGEELKRYTQTAIEWEQATGQAVEKTAEQFSSLQKDPLAAVLKLNEGTNFLTASVYEQIASLEKQGDKAGAAELAMNALDAAMRERSKAIQDSLGYIERGWIAAKNAAKEAWDAMLGVGRSATLGDEIARVQAQIDQQMAQPLAVDTPEMRASREKGIANKQRELTLLQDKLALEELDAAASAESARITQSRIEFDKKYAQALQSQLSLQDKLALARKEAADAGKSEAEITQVLAYITEQHNKSIAKGGDGRKAAQSSYQSLMVAINQSVAASENELKVGEKLTESQKLRLRYEQELATKKRGFTQQEKANIEMGLLAAEAAERNADAAKKRAKALEEEAKAYDKQVKKQEAFIASIRSSVDKLRLEEEGHMLAAAANISHAEAVERITLARLEESYAQMLQGAGSLEEIERIRAEIAARKELLGVLGQKAAREANAKAAEEAAKEWERTSKTIGDTLADYIMGGGKNAAQYLKRLFSTLVLQPMVQTVVGGAMGSLGLGGPTKGGAGGSLNALSAGKGLWDAWSGSTGGMLASGVSALGSLTGSVFLGELGSAIAAGVELGISGAAALTSSASATTTAGMWLGAAAPWVAGIGALMAIVPSFLNGGTPHVGAAALYSGGRLSDYGADYTSHTAVTRSYEEAMQKPVSAIVTSIGGALDAMAKTFGKQSGYSVSTGFSADNDDPAAALLSIIDPAGNSPVYWTAGRFGALDTRRNSKFSSDAKEGFDQYLQSITAEVIPVFKGIVPGWADNLLTQLSDSLGVTQAIESGDPYAWQQMTASGQEAFQALQNTLAQITMIKQAFAALGDTMTVLADLSDEAQTSLLQKFGGIEALGKSAESFYQNFFTADEQRSKLQAKLGEAFSAVDLTLPDIDASNAREQYRALAEAQDLATESGRAAWAVIMQLGEAFASITPSIEDAKKALEAQANALNARVLAVQDKYSTPERRLNARYDSIAGGLIGAGLSNMQQPELSSMLMQSSKDEIYALALEVWNLGHLSLDARNALLDAADALADLKDAAQQQRDGLMATLWQMTGNVQALRDKELAALEPTNRALQVLIYTLGDLQTAAAEAAQKTQQAWSSWSTASGLALQYTGDSSGLRAQEAILRAQLSSAGVVDTGKLQELIGIEQSLFNAQKQKQEEAQRLQAQITQERLSGLSDELAAARALADAAKRLGDYAHDLFSSSASGLSDSDRMAALAAEYGALKTSARSGNVDAFGRLQSVTGDYLGLASTLATSGSDYSITAGRMAAELEALAKAQELVGQSQATGIEAQMEQLTAQTQIAQEQFEVSSIAKALIAKSMQDQVDIWDRENTQRENLLALQERATLSLSTMHLDFGKAMSPLLAGAASNIERPISARLDVLIGALSPANTGSASVRVPAYAVGTNVVPRDMLAQIHEGEAIIPKAFNPWAGGVGMNGGQGGLGSPAVLAEIRALREQNALLQALLQSIERNSQQLAQQFDAVTAGGNAMATEVMA